RFSKPFFPIRAYHLPDVVFFGACEPFGRGLAACGVHAHVERPVAQEAEAAGGLVELRRGDAEVEEHAYDAAHAALLEGRSHLRDRCVYQLKTRIFERTTRKRRGVLIKSEKSSANPETGEDGLAVPAAAKGAIDIGFAFTDIEGSDCFFE